MSIFGVFDEPSDFELGLRYSRAIVDELSVGDALGPPDLEAGGCDECGDEAHQRWQHGRFALCRYCRRRRLEAGAKVERMVIPEYQPLPGPPLSEQQQQARRLAGDVAA